MCHHETYALPPHPQSVKAARSFLRQCLDAWELPGLAPDATLVLSELVTNGVLHAGTPVTVTISSGRRSVELAVTDGSPLPPTPRPQREDLHADLAAVLAHDLPQVDDDRDPRLHVGAAGSVTGGRGLLLVTELADTWGSTAQGGSKTVWARLPHPPGQQRDDCPCTEGPAAVALASGELVVRYEP